jgi:serine/threonine protein kinase
VHPANGRAEGPHRIGPEPPDSAIVTPRVLSTLHRSELSTVYLTDIDRPEPVVRKVVRHSPEPHSDRPLECFLREHEVVAGLRHANVVKIFDLGVARDHAYIVMEYLQFGSLAQRMRRPLEPTVALDYARQTADALACMHAAGVLHRDLKPANIMFRDDETLALIDFGLAKQLDAQASLTAGGQVCGTPHYMSPEQGYADVTDARSDLYGLGCILFEMLTGRKPFTGVSTLSVIYRHAHAPRPHLPAMLAGLQPVLDRLLAIDPEQRYRSATELGAALDSVRGRSADASLRARAAG